jgi:hypothetical protein
VGVLLSIQLSNSQDLSFFKTVVARLDRAIQYAAASRFITAGSGILDHPLSRVMTVGVVQHTFTISRRNAPELCVSIALKTEGAGKAGCSPHPQPRVQNE